MNIQQATDFILDSDNPARWLSMLDKYIQLYNSMPGTFVLPREHVVLAPVLEALARSPEKLPAYIKAVRDTLPRGGLQQDVNALYRTVMTRFLQQDRRARMLRAVEKAVERWGPMTKDERIRYESKLYTLWGRLRSDLLAKGKSSSGKHLNTDERSEILELFWKDIDERIDSGDIPPVDRGTK